MISPPSEHRGLCRYECLDPYLHTDQCPQRLFLGIRLDMRQNNNQR